MYVFAIHICMYVHWSAAIDCSVSCLYGNECASNSHTNTLSPENMHMSALHHTRIHARMCTYTHLLIKDKVHSICVGREYVVLERDWSPICVHHMARLWQVHMWAYAVVRERWTQASYSQAMLATILHAVLRQPQSIGPPSSTHQTTYVRVLAHDTLTEAHMHTHPQYLMVQLADPLCKLVGIGDGSR